MGMKRGPGHAYTTQTTPIVLWPRPQATPTSHSHTHLPIGHAPKPKATPTLLRGHVQNLATPTDNKPRPLLSGHAHGALRPCSQPMTRPTLHMPLYKTWPRPLCYQATPTARDHAQIA